MKAVVMAGGEGTRLRPLTSNRPKPLVPVLNKPIAQHIIEHLRRAGVTEIVITLYYLAEEIRNYFGDGSEYGVKLHYSVEDSPLGTAGSVKKAERHLKDDTFVIVSGDALTDVNIEKAVAFHRAKKSEASLILQHIDNPLDFGVVMTEEDGRIVRFMEKPSWGEVFSDTVNTGMYILEPTVFALMEPNKNYDWSQDIFPRMLAEKREMFGYVMEEYWTDVGSLDQYRQAQYDMLNGLTQLPIEGEIRDGNIYIGEGSEIDLEATLTGPIIVGANSRIKAGAVIKPDTVIGDNAIIEDGACLEKAVLWDSVYVGKGANIQGCTICHHCTVKDKAEIHEGAVIGDRCRIENGAVIRAGVKLWPDKVIEAESIVTDSLIWGAKSHATLFRGLGVPGITNIELTPEFATKLGASLGAYLKKGATVVSARDAHPASRMIKRAILSGLMSVGCNVIDVQMQPIPLLRVAIRSNNAQAGINVRIDPDHPRSTMVEFFDKQGIYLTKNAERKIETIFFREDYGRADIEEIGEITYDAHSLEQYRERFFVHINEKDISRRRFKVVVDYAYGRISSVLPELLAKLGLEVIALNAYSDPDRAPKSAVEREALMYNLSQVVLTLHCDIGVQFQSDGERIALVDEKGEPLTGARLLATIASLVAQTRPGAKAAVPVNAPSVVEQVMHRANGTTRRTKTDPRFLMTVAAHAGENIAIAGDMEGGFIFPEFHPAYDGLYAFVKTLEMLAWLQRPLSEFVAELPPIHLATLNVRCPWEIKGKVMRRLTEDSLALNNGANGTGGAGRTKTELIDGIKLTQSGGEWALVLPDAAEPVFHVYAEAATQEEALTLAREYVAKIEAITQ